MKNWKKIGLLLFITSCTYKIEAQKINTCSVYQYNGDNATNKSLSLVKQYDRRQNIVSEKYDNYYNDSLYSFSRLILYKYKKKRILEKRIINESNDDTTIIRFYYNRKGLLYEKKEMYVYKPIRGFRDSLYFDTVTSAFYYFNDKVKYIERKTAKTGSVMERKFFFYNNGQLFKDSIVNYFDSTKTHVRKYTYFEKGYSYTTNYIYSIDPYGNNEVYIDSYYVENNLIKTHLFYKNTKKANHELLTETVYKYSSTSLLIEERYCELKTNSISNCMTSLYEYEYY